MTTNIKRLRDYVQDLTQLVDRAANDEPTMLREGRTLLADLVKQDDWLPDAFAVPNPDKYQQYLLYCDPKERFSVVSFVWGPGQSTPIHDHCVWGLIGMLRGRETCDEFSLDGGQLCAGASHPIEPGEVDAVSPTIGDIHKVSNGLKDKASISIHVYGGNIGAVKRHTFNVDGTPNDFISGYSSPLVPNLWDKSREA